MKTTGTRDPFPQADQSLNWETSSWKEKGTDETCYSYNLCESRIGDGSPELTSYCIPDRRNAPSLAAQLAGFVAEAEYLVGVEVAPLAHPVTVALHSAVPHASVRRAVGRSIGLAQLLASRPLRSCR